jgi:hypothetical protein
MLPSIDVALTGHPRYARRQAIGAVPPNARTKGMTTFDKREEGFEQQFAHDEELRFKATVRRNQLIGLWAAEKLRLTGAEAESYAKSIVVGDIENVGKHDVLRKIRQDFDARGVVQSDHQINRAMTELMEKAIADIKAGK